VTCTLPQHSSALVVEAGTAQMPVIHVDGKGYVDTSSTTGAQAIPVTVTSVTPATGSG